MVRLYFLQTVDDHVPGSIGMVERTLAVRLIQSGQAEAYSDYVERTRVENLKAKAPEKKTVKPLKKKRRKKAGLESADRNK